MKRNAALFIFSLFLIAALGSSGQVDACTCATTSPARADYKVKISEGPEIEVEAEGFDFKVAELIGDAEKISRATIAGEPTTCGFDFKLDETYLVYAFKTSDGQYTTSACSHTAKLSDAKEDLKFRREVLPKPAAEICDPEGLNFNISHQISKDFQNFSDFSIVSIKTAIADRRKCRKELGHEAI
jgi:hypothetical protein